MVPPIERDPRVWLIALHSDACPFTREHGITECCELLQFPGKGDDRCTLENCPRKITIGQKLIDEVRDHD